MLCKYLKLKTLSETGIIIRGNSFIVYYGQTMGYNTFIKGIQLVVDQHTNGMLLFTFSYDSPFKYYLFYDIHVDAKTYFIKRFRKYETYW